MRTSLWLAASELRARLPALATQLAFVAAAVALLVGLELSHRARENAVSRQMDFAGPAMRIVPAGIDSMELKRLKFGEALLPTAWSQEVTQALGDDVRRVEQRLVRWTEVGGREVPVIGLEPDSNLGRLLGLDAMRPDAVVFGADAAIRFRRGAGIGSSVRFFGHPWQVGSAERLGTVEDAAAFVALGTLQERLALGGRINELRVFTAAQVDAESLAATIRARFSAAAIHRNADRGNDAERQTEGTLATHRLALYGLVSVVVALGLIVSAFINARERRTELAMFFVMGAGRTTVAAIVLARSTVVGATGGALGLLLGFLVASLQEPGAEVGVSWSWWLALVTLASSAALSAAAALPVSWAVARADHGRALQG